MRQPAVRKLRSDERQNWKNRVLLKARGSYRLIRSHRFESRFALVLRSGPANPHHIAAFGDGAIFVKNQLD